MVSSSFTSVTAPITDLVLGASLYFPPLFKAVLIGSFVWLMLHPLLRDWMYSGQIWHPTLMDLSIYVLCISTSLWLWLVIAG